MTLPCIYIRTDIVTEFQTWQIAIRRWWSIYVSLYRSLTFDPKASIHKIPDWKGMSTYDGADIEFHALYEPSDGSCYVNMCVSMSCMDFMTSRYVPKNIHPPSYSSWVTRSPDWKGMSTYDGADIEFHDVDLPWILLRVNMCASMSCMDFMTPAWSGESLSVSFRVVLVV